MLITKITSKDDSKLFFLEKNTWKKSEKNSYFPNKNRDYTLPLWQTKKWQDLLLKTNLTQAYIHIYFEEKEKILMELFFEIRSIWAGFFWAFCIFGPNGDEKILQENKKHILSFLKKNTSVLFVQIEPQFPISLYKEKKHYKRFIYQYTARINLQKNTEEDILKNMKSKGRYNIRLAEKKWVSIEQVSVTKKNISFFFQLIQDTTARKGFSTNSEKFFENMLHSWEHRLYFAYKDEKIIAAGIFSFTGNTCVYYYGASTHDRNYKKLMAPYLLQWKVIQDAKKERYMWYDFLGISKPGKKDSLAGVTDFKMKFWPETHMWPNEQVYVFRKFRYFLFLLLKKIHIFLKIIKIST